VSAEELVDVVDENDCVVGRTTRREVRAKNLRHRGVYILVFNSAGRLFVHRRTPNKDIFPSYWDVAIGGVVAAGEAYDAAARREFEEELGVHDVRLRRLFPARYEDASNSVSGMVYSCTCDGPFTLQAAEIASGEWMDLDVLIERTQQLPFCPDGLEVLRLYLSKLDAARAAQRQRDPGRPV
jgi:isopentenyldiphosphate isomerase